MKGLPEGPSLFGDAQIEAAIDKALLSIPKGKKGALVAYADLDGISFAVVARAGRDWEFIGRLEKGWGGQWRENLKAEVAIQRTW